jgi:hypothetical protein
MAVVENDGSLGSSAIGHIDDQSLALPLLNHPLGRRRIWGHNRNNPVYGQDIAETNMK